MKTRLFVSRDLINGAEALLEGDRARYLGRVLRLRVGDDINVFDGTGPEWSATISAMTKSSATLSLGERHESTMESPLKVHLEGVAASACEQCGRTRLPLIDTPLPLKHWFGDRPADADLDLILAPGASTPLARVTPLQTKVCILIGPEGGFSQTEYEDADVADFEAVSLGPRILRTETAAAAALAVMQANWGDLNR
jgi:16S rRNA (uracil1498-N3)-methyltransferase